MKKQTQIDKNKPMHIGYTSPGWPLANFPNGIVSYVQNILYGFESDQKPVVFAAPLIGVELKNQLINLSKFSIRRSFLQRITDGLIYRIKLPFSNAIRYKRVSERNALKIHLGMEELDAPLDILEMEESFGTAFFLMKKSKVPIVIRLHGPCITTKLFIKADENWDYKLRVFYEGQAIISSHGVTAPSLDVLDRVREFYGVALPNAQVIFNPAPVIDEYKQWNFSYCKTPTILFVGRFDSHKGGDLAITAFRYIASKNLDVELLFVGPDIGINIEGNILLFNEYVERYISEPNIKKRIQFLGHCDSSVIAKLRKESLITIVCSRYETFCISLVEALATGCPTVATAVGGIKEIIFNGYNGLLAEPESPESIAENVLALMANPEKMQILSNNAIEDCKKRFSPKVVAAQTVEYYKSVLARRSP